MHYTYFLPDLIITHFIFRNKGTQPPQKKIKNINKKYMNLPVDEDAYWFSIINWGKTHKKKMFFLCSEHLEPPEPPEPL